MTRWVWFLPIAKRGESNAPRGMPGLSSSAGTGNCCFPERKHYRAMSSVSGQQIPALWESGMGRAGSGVGLNMLLQMSSASPGWDCAVPALWAVGVGPAATHGDITALCTAADTDSAFPFSREFNGE